MILTVILNHIPSLINEFTSFVNNLLLRSAILFFQYSPDNKPDRDKRRKAVPQSKLSISKGPLAGTKLLIQRITNAKNVIQRLATVAEEARIIPILHSFSCFRQTGTTREVLASTEWRGRNQCLKERTIMKIVAS